MSLKIIVDSNVLFRILISGGNILDIVFDKNLKILAPLKLKEEFINNEQGILKKSGLSEENFNKLTSIIFKRISFIPLDKYKEFMPKAKELLGEHEKDLDFVALSLLKNTKIWTYEDLLFKIGTGISTKEISKQLDKK